MKRRRFIGYDLNGRRDMAARSWIIHPGEEEEVDGTFMVSGGLNGAVVRADIDSSDRFFGGALARLAPHGRGRGWGKVGALDRRKSTQQLVREPDRNIESLSTALSALGSGADVAVASLDDTPGIREVQLEAWLRSMRQCRNRRCLHVWRPVLSVLSAIEDGLLDGISSVAVISQHARGIASQRLLVREDRVRAPERRQAGQLHECTLGFDFLVERAQKLVGARISANERDEELEHLEMPSRIALGLDQIPELYRRWNGTWAVVPEIDNSFLAGEILPAEIRKELAGVEAVVMETLAEGPVRANLESLIAAVSDTKPIVLSPRAVAQGALIAAKRLFNGEPVYFDYLPQISTIVQDGRGPKNFDLIPPEATLPAGKVYRSEAPAKLALQQGQTQITIYVRKELEVSPRKAVLELPIAPERIEEIKCLVEQAPAQGSARILLESNLFHAPVTIDWDKTEEIDKDWQTLLSSLETPKPTIPNRMVLPATHEMWEDLPQRTGLRTLLLEAQGTSEPNWSALAGKLSSREGGAYCLSSDGEPPAGTTSNELEILSEIQDRALELTLRRAEGKIVTNDNDALRFQTWLFKRCSKAIIVELLKALNAQVGQHPFVFHHATKRLIYQGLGRVLTEASDIRKVFDHLMEIPVKNWNSMNHVACAAFLLSRTDEAPAMLTRSEVDKLASIGIRTLKEGVKNQQQNTLHYPPFLLVGLLRWRVVDNWALVAGSDATADMMLEAVNYALPRLKRQAESRPNLRRLYKALSDVREELKGAGRNPDLLLEFASL